MDEGFFLERIEISKGRQAVVYLWEDRAYKVFPESYPIEAIRYELQVQAEISKTSLPVPNYYPTDDPYIVAMDYIEGVTLTERMIHEGYFKGIEDLLELQRNIHFVNRLNLPAIDEALQKEILKSDYAESFTAQARQYIKKLGRADNLCHLDFHPSNLIFTNNHYMIVDWVNAKLGQPVYDLARTYVILFEAAPLLADHYLDLLVNSGEDLDRFSMAVYVMALWRAKEMQNPKALDLLNFGDRFL